MHYYGTLCCALQWGNDDDDDDDDDDGVYGGRLLEARTQLVLTLRRPVGSSSRQQ